MKYAFTAIALAAALTTASAQSAPPSAAQIAQHEVQRYANQLSLTTEQQEQATTLFTAAATAESGLRAEQFTAHKALSASILTGDTATIGQAATMLGQLEGERTSARALAEAKLYKILNADQQAKFAATLDRPMGPGFGGGHGGPPPPQ